MKILLLGEYSNVHWTLAEGLRQLGHEVTVVSDGDVWKNYPRDIDLRRKGRSKWSGLRYYADVCRLMPKLKDFDVVQLINPVFLELKAERIGPFYRRVRRQNRSLFLGAFGMDHYWVKAGMDCRTFRYSDFNMGNHVRENADNRIWIADWLEGPKGKLNELVACDCDGIISGLYEYDASYRPYFPDKLRFIPFPIDLSSLTPKAVRDDKKMRCFIGVQRGRDAYKGTDIMLKALERVQREFPESCEIVKVESVPYAEYERLMNNSDVLLDQLYSYTPGMNALLAMGKGLVVVGGGESENYEILCERELRPIVNVEPNEESVYEALRHLAEHREEIAGLSRQSVAYIRKHHDHVSVAQRYLDFWTEQMNKKGL
jgi:glycosyltransferase involved in cell wall biosynthesis